MCLYRYTIYLMDERQATPSEDNQRWAYRALVDYHINMVQLRFTIAGLGFAANGFLISAFFQQYQASLLIRLGIIIPGIALTLVCWLLEIRTVQLLLSLQGKGKNLEALLRLNQDQGFFQIMDVDAKIPQLKPVKAAVSSLFSHRSGISVLYGIFILFWLITFVYTLASLLH